MIEGGSGRFDYCPQCGKLMRVGMPCAHCAKAAMRTTAQPSAFCHRCGTGLPEGAAFCMACGTALAAPSFGLAGGPGAAVPMLGAPAVGIAVGGRRPWTGYASVPWYRKARNMVALMVLSGVCLFSVAPVSWNMTVARAVSALGLISIILICFSVSSGPVHSAFLDTQGNVKTWGVGLKVLAWVLAMPWIAALIWVLVWALS